MDQKRRGGNGWVSLAIFLVFIFGSRIIPPLAAWLTQATGIAINPMVLIVGVIVLAVAVSLLRSVSSGIGRINSGSETRLPTQAAAPPRSSTGQGGPPPAPFGGQQPSAPRFEPVIDPRILLVGIGGLVVFGGIFLAILAATGGI
jgi:hypothetical protein